MAPAASRLRVEPELGSLPKRALAQYLLFLKLYPVATKAVSRWAHNGKRGGKEGCQQGRLSCRGGYKRGCQQTKQLHAARAAVVLSL